MAGPVTAAPGNSPRSLGNRARKPVLPQGPRKGQSSLMSYRELLSGEVCLETLLHSTTCSHNYLDAIIAEVRVRGGWAVIGSRQRLMVFRFALRAMMGEQVLERGIHEFQVHAWCKSCSAPAANGGQTAAQAHGPSTARKPHHAPACTC